jgi:hypothetical protein
LVANACLPGEAWRAVMTTPAVMTRSETTWPTIAAAPPRRMAPSHKRLSPMEMTGSAVVTMAWTGARNLPC